MAIQISGQSLKTGAPGQSFPQDQQSAPVFTELNPRYYQNVYQGNVFSCANSGTQALSVASGTFTGLAVGNPLGTGKNLVILEVTAGVSAALAVVSSVAIVGTQPYVALTAGTAIGPNPMLVGSGASSVAKVGASATLAAAPTVLRVILGTQWVTGAQAANLYVKDDVGGAIVVTPGNIVCIAAVVAAMSIVGSITWLELPI